MIEAETALLEVEEPFVLEDSEVQFEFPVGKLQVEGQAGGPTVRVIAVAEFEQKILVCVPFSAWRKKVAQRALPAGTLQKPSRLEVAACGLEDRSNPIPDEMMKVWMGFFTKSYAENVVVSSLDEEVSVDFEMGRVPFAEALRDLSTEHFAFFSAEPQVVGEGGGSGSADLEARVHQIESVLDEVNKNLGLLLSRDQAPPKEDGRKSALKQPKAKVQAAMPPRSDMPVEDFPDLDPGVVSAARQAGVDTSVLVEMQKLVSSGRKGAKSLKQTAIPKNSNVLSESEDEEDGDGGLADGDASSPVASALTKLTAIVGHLAAKGTNKKSSPLEQALDGVSFSAGDTALLGGGRRCSEGLTYRVPRRVVSADRTVDGRGHFITEPGAGDDIPSMQCEIMDGAQVSDRPVPGSCTLWMGGGGYHRQPQIGAYQDSKSTCQRAPHDDRPVLCRPRLMGPGGRSGPGAPAAIRQLVKPPTTRRTVGRGSFLETFGCPLGRARTEPPEGAGGLPHSASQLGKGQGGSTEEGDDTLESPDPRRRPRPKAKAKASSDTQ